MSRSIRRRARRCRRIIRSIAINAGWRITGSMMWRFIAISRNILAGGLLPSCLDIINGIPMTRDHSELLLLGNYAHDSYLCALPYPHICLDNFLDARVVAEVAAEFPELGRADDIRFNDPNQSKLASRGEHRFGPVTRELVHYLNSQPFLEYLGALTGIKGLLPDPYFAGGGLHEIRRGGFLKIHADFNRHPDLQLDRRINLLLYLNENWEESYGGHLELWDGEMKTCVKRFLPVFNRMVIFNTTDLSYHGHPDPLACPEDRSRRSLALYYYTIGEGRADNRINTKFMPRAGDSVKMRNYNRVKDFVTNVMPPFLLRLFYKRLK
jgi:hypothetical protein